MAGHREPVADRPGYGAPSFRGVRGGSWSSASIGSSSPATESGASSSSASSQYSMSRPSGRPASFHSWRARSAMRRLSSSSFMSSSPPSDGLPGRPREILRPGIAARGTAQPAPLLEAFFPPLVDRHSWTPGGPARGRHGGTGDGGVGIGGGFGHGTSSGGRAGGFGTELIVGVPSAGTASMVLRGPVPQGYAPRARVHPLEASWRRRRAGPDCVPRRGYPRWGQGT